MSDTNHETSFNFQASQEKLDTLKPVLMNLAPERVRQYNLSVPSSVSSAMKIYKSYCEDRHLFTRYFTVDAFDPEQLTDFPIRVGALWQSDVLLSMAMDPTSGMDEVQAEAKPLHGKFSKAAAYLWLDDPELGPIVSSIREGYGYMDRADDLARYAALFFENWATAAGNCNITLADIEKAREISATILDAISASSQSNVQQLRDLRNRAGEYLRRGVEEIRSCAAYIYRNDAQGLMRYPSLFASNYVNRKKRTPPPPEEDGAVDELNSEG